MRTGVNYPGGLTLALLGSASLHLWLLFGLHLPPAAPVRIPQTIEARLAAPTPEVAAEVAPETAAAPPPAPRHRPPVRDRVTPLAAAQTAPQPPPPNTAAPAATRPAVPAPPALHDQPPAPTTQAAGTGTSNKPSSPVYFSTDQVDQSPRMLDAVGRIYPARARDAGIEGYVIVSLLIDERGRVDEIHVVKSEPAGYFEESAVAMLRNQHFSPALKHGLAVKSRLQSTIRFRLEGG